MTSSGEIIFRFELAELTFLPADAEVLVVALVAEEFDGICFWSFAMCLLLLFILLL